MNSLLIGEILFYRNEKIYWEENLTYEKKILYYIKLFATPNKDLNITVLVNSNLSFEQHYQNKKIRRLEKKKL